MSYSVTAPLNATGVLSPKQSPYMFDVVELFMTFSEAGFPYFEFEVSPYNQTFQVKMVTHTRHQEGVGLGLVSSATMSPHGWSAELKIPLKATGLGWRSRGNPREFLFHPGTGAAQLLELIFSPGRKAEFSSAAIFSTLASM